MSDAKYCGWCANGGYVLDATMEARNAAEDERDAAYKQCASAERELNEAWTQLDRYLAALKAEAIRISRGGGGACGPFDVGGITFRVTRNAAGELVAEEVTE
jgi:hypothetical protein